MYGPKVDTQIDPVKAINDRCAQLGLTPEAPRAIGKESGYDGDAAACWAIGLDPSTLQPLRQRNWARIAARSSSVSYRLEMPEYKLKSMLTSGLIAPAVAAHVAMTAKRIVVLNPKADVSGRVIAMRRSAAAEMLGGPRERQAAAT